MGIFSKLFGDEQDAFIKDAEQIVEQINALEPDVAKLADEELPKKTAAFRARLEEGETLDDLLPEAFALVREAAKRTLGQRHYDVQLIGGLALHQGRITEQKTGEGKTLASTLPVYLNALAGKGVHVVTVNDYLSRRDTVWMGQIYHALGLSVACLNNQAAYVYDASYTEDEELDEERDELGSFKVVHEFLRPAGRKEVYQADIVYGTNNEFGFDYLRDNLAQNFNDVVQRPEQENPWHYAIIDEVDSILIDEARTPLIISRPDEESADLYETFAKIVPTLKEGEDEDYTLDEKSRAVLLTERGIEKVEKKLNIDNIYGEGDVKLVHHLEQALKAYALFHKDENYIVKDDQVIIVDEFTGRLMPGRRYSEGLHQAIEAKEGVEIQRESRTVATITFQNYFRKYEKLAGMTGTALTSREEFYTVYGTETVAIPTHKPVIRDDRSDNVYRTREGKFRAVAREIKEVHETGQPILVGTVSIEKNEYVSTLLKQMGVPHKVLNAKNHEQDAQVVAQAGAKGAVTVATNIAGRGVDIVLGGNPPDTERKEEVKELGGLHVIGTERHEARRIDDQLRGRAGRQGDPGSSQFFVSMEDDLMRIFGGEKVQGMMERLNIPEDEAIKSPMVSKAIESAQDRIEGHHFDIRKHVLQYDEVINKHREAIYRMRRGLINPQNDTSSKELAWEMLTEEIGHIIAEHTSETGLIDYGEMATALRRVVPLGDEDMKAFAGALEEKGSAEEIEEYLIELVTKAYAEKTEAAGEEAMRATERAILLRVIDELWMDHLDYMSYMKRSVGLRAVGQRDPLVEYKNEASRQFKVLRASIRSQVAELLLRVGVQKRPEQSQQDTNLVYTGPAKTAQKQNGSSGGPLPGAQPGRKKVGRKIGRNEKVVVTDGTKKKTMKYKKAEELLEKGTWKLVEVKDE